MAEASSITLIAVLLILKLLQTTYEVNANKIDATKNELPGLHLTLSSNKTKGLQSSETIQIDFEIKKLEDKLDLRNVLLQVEIPYPAMKLISMVNKYGNMSDSIPLNQTTSILNMTYQQLQHQANVTLLVQTSESFESQEKLMLKYKIQYLFNATFEKFSFAKVFYANPLQPFVSQRIRIEPKNIEGEDLLNISITIINKNSTNTAYNSTLKITMANIFDPSVICTNINTTVIEIQNHMILMTFGELKPDQNISCGIKAIVGNNLELGGKLKFPFVLSYYHKMPQINLYPIEETVIKYLNVPSIIIAGNSSSNLSSLQAGDIFKLDIKFWIPKSASVLNATIKFPTYQIATGNGINNNSKTAKEHSLVYQNLTQNVSYQFGSSISNYSAPVTEMVNTSMLNINFGEIKSLGGNRGSVGTSSITIHLNLQIVNDPINVYGMNTFISVIAGNSNLQIPLRITAPVLYPILSVKKSVKVLDASKESPLISFTIVIQHTNTSTVDADNIRVIDVTENMAIHSNDVKPNGKFELASSNGYIMTINVVIDRLQVSQNATVTYTGAFIKGYENSYFKRKASVSWQSAQVNNNKVFTEYSQEICLRAVKQIVIKHIKSYTMVLLGVAAGIIFGILVGLLVVFCLRKLKMAKTYVFTDIMEESEDEEAAKHNGIGDSHKLTRLDTLKKSLTGRQSRPNQKLDLQKLTPCNWPLMITAKYDKMMVEKSRSRTLIEQLIRGYDNSFKYFVLSLSQAIDIFATKLRSNGDISAENLRKIQFGINATFSKFTQESQNVDNQSISKCENLEEVGRKYLERQCSLIQIAKTDCSSLFNSMFTPNIGEEKTEEMKSEFEDIERAVFSHANGLRAKTYLHAKQTQISQVGFDFLLNWSQKVFYLWCQWMSKKLRRELDILQRKRAITDVDTKTLNISIDNIFKQGEISYEEELHKKAVALQKEMSFDFEAFLKNLDDELQTQLKKIIAQPTQGTSKSLSEALELDKKRFELFAEKTNSYGTKIEEYQNDMFAKTLEMINEVSTYHLKDISGNIELIVIKYFSQTPSAGKGEPQSNGIEVTSQEMQKATKEETMKMILESLEDIQADYNEAQTTSEAMIDDFREEIQTIREDVQHMVSNILQETNKLIEEPIIQSRFHFKSLLYFLRDLSLSKMKSILGSWSSHLHLTLTEMYLRSDLKKFAEIKPAKEDDDKNEENVIYWFKPVDSIARNEFEKIKRGFAAFVEQQKNELRGLFQEQTESLKNIAKSYIFMDLKEDSVYIRKLASLKQEFLIVHEFIVNLLDEFENNQQLADPEVKECFTKFDKAIRSLIAKEEDDGSFQKLLKQEINDLMHGFKKDCESLQTQQNFGASGKIDQLIFDQDGIINKIKRMIYSKKEQNELISTLEKLQNENLALLAHLRTLDRIPYPTFMMLVKVVHSNLSKTRFDEIMKAIDGNPERDYFTELSTYLAHQENSKEREENEDKDVAQTTRKRKKRKKNKTMKRNAIGPEPE